MADFSTCIFISGVYSHYGCARWSWIQHINVVGALREIRFVVVLILHEYVDAKSRVFHEQSRGSCHNVLVLFGLNCDEKD